MSDQLTIDVHEDRAVDLRVGDQLLMRYVFRPDTPADESPRPYAHPVRTRAGEVLTNLRPNDHRWHHGLSLTLTRAGGANFWGGPSYRKADGYQWRADHGVQRHRAWTGLSPERLAQAVDWVDAAGRVVLSEARELRPALSGATGWTLRWTSQLENVSGQDLVLGNYHSSEGLAGSHYTGLQFRGARDLLDEHGDKAIGLEADGGLEGEKAVHGTRARWVAWRGQKDGSQRRVRVTLADESGGVHWFVRRGLPLAVFSFHLDQDRVLRPGEKLVLDHTLTFTDE